MKARVAPAMLCTERSDVISARNEMSCEPTNPLRVPLSLFERHDLRVRTQDYAQHVDWIFPPCSPQPRSLRGTHGSDPAANDR